MVVHGEGYPAPVYTAAQLFYLPVNAVTVFFFPFKSVFQKLLAAESMFVNPSIFQHLHYLGFGSNGSMVTSRNPAGVQSTHPGSSDKNVLNGFVKGMPHMQHTGYIRRGNTNGNWLPFIVKALKVFVFFPDVIPFLFRYRRIIIFAQFHKK